MKPEDRWLEKTDGFFQRLPPVVQILFVLSAVLGMVASLIPELQIGLPTWLRVLLFAPIALIFLFQGMPFLIIRWVRALGWPLRKASSLMKKTR